MNGQDKAASPVFKVIDALACGRHGPGVRACLADRLADLGIDPDMNAEEMHRWTNVVDIARRLIHADRYGRPGEFGTVLMELTRAVDGPRQDPDGSGLA